MTNALATQNGNLAVVNEDPIMRDDALWRIVSSGDLGGLNPKQKSDYYLYRCRQEGLNPASQPFVYMKMQGKEILYAGKTAADQLRKLHGITLRIVDQQQIHDVWQVTVEATAPDGRTDTDIGVVTLGAAKGDALGNALMKAVTKAKRRVTYSICGTGVLDETEMETIPGVQRTDSPSRTPDAATAPVRAHTATPVPAVVVDAETGEIQQANADTVKALKTETAQLASDLKMTAKDVQAYAKTINADYRTIGGAKALRDALSDMLSAQEDQNDDEEDYEGIEAEQGTLIDADVKPIDRWG